MSTINQSARIAEQDILGEADWKAAFKRYLEFQNPLNEYTRHLLRGNLGMLNWNGSYSAPLKCAHGVEKVFQNPLPRGQRPVEVLAVSCDTQAVRSLKWRFTQDPNGGQIGVTINFDVPPNYCQATTTATQNFPTSGTPAALQFAASPTTQVGTLLTYNGSDTITVKQAGFYSVFSTVRWAGNSTGSRLVRLLRSGTAFGGVGFQAPPSPENAYCAVAQPRVPLSANDAITASASQTSGGALATATSAAFPAELSVGLVDWDSTTTANVTFRVIGA